MCKKAGLLVAFNRATKLVLVTRADCDTWSCDECSKRMSSKWSMRASMGARDMITQGQCVDFVTVTSHEKLKTFSQCNYVWPSAWKKLYSRLMYAYTSDCRAQYLLVPERHKDGRLHVHALWNFTVTHAWLKKNARSCGLGYQCDVKSVKNGLNAARYVAKYLSKSLGDDVPKRFRRVRTSRNWIDTESPKSFLSDLKWTYVTTNRELESVYKSAQYLGYDMFDVGSGQLFDDVYLDALEIYPNTERVIK